MMHFDVTDRLKNTRFAGYFFLGLSGVLVLYLLLFLTLLLSRDATLRGLERHLPHQTLALQVPSSLVLPVGGKHPLTPAPARKAPVSEKSPAGDPDQELKALLMTSREYALPSAPLEKLTEKTDFGLLPVTAPDGLTPFSAYKKPFMLNRDKPALAIAVLDYGLSPSLTEMILKDLPSEISLILNPYTDAPEAWQKKARDSGHELWIQLMIVTRDFPETDPGAQGLLLDVPLKYNQNRLAWTLGRMTRYAGVAAFTDSTLKSADTVFQSLAKDIFHRGLGYLELNPSRSAFFGTLAVEQHVPTARNALFAEALSEGHPEREKIKALLSDQGGGVVILKPTASNIAFLKTEIPALKAKGVQIVPVSALAALSVDEE